MKICFDIVTCQKQAMIAIARNADQSDCSPIHTRSYSLTITSDKSCTQEEENVKLSCTMSCTPCLACCVCLMSPTRRRMKSLYTVPHAAFRSARHVRHKPMVKSGLEDDCWEQGWTERRIWDTEFSIALKDGFNCQLQLRRLQY